MSNAFNAFADDVEQFYHAHIRTSPANQAEKVRLEAVELVEEPTSLAEAADVLISLMSWTFASGHGPKALLLAAEAKMERNNQRQWGTDPTTGEVRHINME